MSPTVTRVDADLEFSVEIPGEDIVTGRLRGQGNDLRLTVSDPSAFASPSDASSVRDLADELARLGLRIHIAGESGRTLLSIGAVRGPWWQRPVTRSKHLRVGGLRGLLPVARRAAAAGSRARLTPPGTPYPIAPTFLRRAVRRTTTTHDPHRGGGPRLVEIALPEVTVSDFPVHWLQQPVTTIGSDPSCDIVLSGLEAVHAEVRHNDEDEFVVLAREGVVRVHGARVDQQLLRTSARIELGARALTFVRDEWADHGRPHGGRIGGELGRQRPQPPRRDAEPAEG